MNTTQQGGKTFGFVVLILQFYIYLCFLMRLQLPQCWIKMKKKEIESKGSILLKIYSWLMRI